MHTFTSLWHVIFRKILIPNELPSFATLSHSIFRKPSKYSFFFIIIIVNWQVTSIVRGKLVTCGLKAHHEFEFYYRYKIFSWDSHSGFDLYFAQFMDTIRKFMGSKFTLLTLEGCSLDFLVIKENLSLPFISIFP